MDAQVQHRILVVHKANRRRHHVSLFVCEPAELPNEDVLSPRRRSLPSPNTDAVISQGRDPHHVVQLVD